MSEFTIELVSPSFDIAVERAVKYVNEEWGQGGKIEFIGMFVALREWYGRDNDYIYKFKLIKER